MSSKTLKAFGELKHTIISQIEDDDELFSPEFKEEVKVQKNYIQLKGLFFKHDIEDYFEVWLEEYFYSK